MNFAPAITALASMIDTSALHLAHAKAARNALEELFTVGDVNGLPGHVRAAMLGAYVAAENAVEAGITLAIASPFTAGFTAANVHEFEGAFAALVDYLNLLAKVLA